MHSLRDLSHVRSCSGDSDDSLAAEIASQPSAEQVSQVLESIAAINVQNNVQTGALGLERMNSAFVGLEPMSELDTLDEEEAT